MITDTSQNVNTENAAVECQFGDAIKELKISNTLRASNFLNSKKQDTAFSKNTYYRFLNESKYNRKHFLTLLAVRVTDYFNSLT